MARSLVLVETRERGPALSCPTGEGERAVAMRNAALPIEFGAAALP